MSRLFTLLIWMIAWPLVLAVRLIDASDRYDNRRRRPYRR